MYPRNTWSDPFSRPYISKATVKWQGKWEWQHFRNPWVTQREVVKLLCPSKTYIEAELSILTTDMMLYWEGSWGYWEEDGEAKWQSRAAGCEVLSHSKRAARSRPLYRNPSLDSSWVLQWSSREVFSSVQLCHEVHMRATQVMFLQFFLKLYRTVCRRAYFLVFPYIFRHFLVSKRDCKSSLLRVS